MRERVRKKKKSRKPGRSRNLYAQVGTCKDGVSLTSGLIGHCPYVCDCPREASPWSQTNTPVPGDRKALRGSRWKVRETRSPATASHKLWGSTSVTAVWATEQLLHHLCPSAITQKCEKDDAAHSRQKHTEDIILDLLDLSKRTESQPSHLFEKMTLNWKIGSKNFLIS